eukprot:scaffold9942_cov57-Phaeocystis_antarctica.AAC.1
MQRLATSRRGKTAPIASAKQPAWRSRRVGRRVAEPAKFRAVMLGFSSAAVALLDVSGMLPTQPLKNAVSLGLPDDAWPRGVPLRIVVLGTSPTS